MVPKDLVVVGIGSSAGGLEALQVMLSKLSDNLNCSTSKSNTSFYDG